MPPSVKYHGKNTYVLWAPTVNTAPYIDISGSSRQVSIQEQAQSIDTTTRDDARENATSQLSTSPTRTVSVNGLDTTPGSSREWHKIKVQGEGTLAVYPNGKDSGAPYEMGNVVCNNRNFDSPYDNTPTYQLDFGVKGVWNDELAVA